MFWWKVILARNDGENIYLFDLDGPVCSHLAFALAAGVVGFLTNARYAVAVSMSLPFFLAIVGGSVAW